MSTLGIEKPHRCKKCGYVADDLADATDHVEDAHSIISEAVLDATEEVEIDSAEVTCCHV
jgi:uncharacterized Zn finger protein